MLAALEHVIPSENIKVVAGGLGNVCALYVEKLPTKGKFVFPRVGGVDYGKNWTPSRPIVFTDPNGATDEVKVDVLTPAGGHVEFIALSHELFLERTKANIYPDSRRPEHFIRWKSLWNRCVADLLLRYRTTGEISVYHALDFHGALAPLYLEASGLKPIPVALTLHNALYQGSLMETLDGQSWRDIELGLLLPNTQYYTEFEGDFNMLHSVVKYIRHHQRGVGITGVSHEYGKQVGVEVPLFKGMSVLGHPNPMLEEKRPVVPGGLDGLAAHKAACKAQTQEELGLVVDPDAILISFVGRWTFEKGIDLIAEAVLWLLDEYQNVQFYICGPIGDEVGQYAASRLESLASIPLISRRLFVKAEFFRVTEHMRFAADFTICPSRTEPFGYVDVEYAWHGTPTIGALVGGLGKVPGVYFHIIEGGDREHVIDQLKQAVVEALTMERALLEEIARACVQVTFPIEMWSAALDEQYLSALAYADRMRPRRPVQAPSLANQPEPGLSKTAMSDAPPSPSARPSEGGSVRRTGRRVQSSIIGTNYQMPAPSRRTMGSVASTTTDAPTAGWQAERWNRRSLVADRSDEAERATGHVRHTNALPYLSMLSDDSLRFSEHRPKEPASPRARSMMPATSRPATLSSEPTPPQAPQPSPTAGRGGVRFALEAPPVAPVVTLGAGLTVTVAETPKDNHPERISERSRARTMFAKTGPQTTMSALFTPYYSMSSTGSLDSEPDSPSPNPRAREPYARRASIGLRKSNMAFGGTAKNLVSPRLKPGQERQELVGKIDAARVTEMVASETIRWVFFKDGKAKMNDVIAHAHKSARVEDPDEYMPVGALLHAVRRGVFSRKILGIEIENLVLVMLEALVPVGSMVLLAIAVFGTPMTTRQIITLFSVHAACIGVGGFGWMLLARRLPIPVVMGAAGLLQLTMVPLLYSPTFDDGRSTFVLTYVLAVFHGLASGGVLPLFHSFNFTNKWSGNTYIAGFRMSLVEPLRTLVTLLFVAATVRYGDLGYVPYSARALFWSVEAITFILSVCCFLLPISRDLRLPYVECSYQTLKLYPSYCFLVLADLVARAGGFLDVLFVAWWFMAGFSRAHIASFFYVIAPISAAVALGFCYVVCVSHAYSRPWLVDMALFIFPPTVLGALAVYSSQRLGPDWCTFFLGVAIVLGVPKRLGASLLKTLALSSRWKYLTYQVHATLLLQLTEALSPLILFGLADAFDLQIDLTDTYTDVFARSFFYLSLPFAALQLVLHLAAIPHLRREGILKIFQSPVPPHRHSHDAASPKPTTQLPVDSSTSTQPIPSAIEPETDAATVAPPRVHHAASELPPALLEAQSSLWLDSSKRDEGDPPALDSEDQVEESFWLATSPSKREDSDRELSPAPSEAVDATNDNKANVEAQMSWLERQEYVPGDSAPGSQLRV